MSFDIYDLTKEEKAAVTRMHNAMKVLSKRHWFYATAGQLNIMRYADSERAFDNDDTTYDQDYIVCEVSDGIDIDGGDW